MNACHEKFVKEDICLKEKDVLVALQYRLIVDNFNDVS